MQPEREPLLQAISPQDQEFEHPSSTSIKVDSQGDTISLHENTFGSSENPSDQGVSLFNDNALPFKNDEKAVSDLSSAPIEHVNSADVAPKTLMAAEGFLAVCGGCRGNILFPLGFTRVGCVHCGAVNYMAPESIPVVPKKALLLCPNCKASILYTIGCTHFQCTCGCVIEIPIPDYYIPHFSSKAQSA